MTASINFLGVEYTEQILSELSLSKLVELRNLVASNLGSNTIKKFPDKPYALKKTWEILQAYGSWEIATEGVEVIIEEKIDEVVKKSKNKTNNFINFLRMRAELPPADEIVYLKTTRSIRAQALVMLRTEEGANLEELKQLFVEADARRKQNKGDIIVRMYQMIRIFCYVYGYGTQSSSDGSRIRLITKQEKWGK